MWIVKNDELINLGFMDSVDYNICSDDSQFELDFYKDGKLIAYLFF